jgi:hypothetical protein
MFSKELANEKEAMVDNNSSSSSPLVPKFERSFGKSRSHVIHVFLSPRDTRKSRMSFIHTHLTYTRCHIHILEEVRERENLGKDQKQTVFQIHEGHPLPDSRVNNYQSEFADTDRFNLDWSSFWRTTLSTGFEHTRHSDEFEGASEYDAET